MEKKKLLLIAVSVGVFLVIVIGACILVVSPKGPSPAAAAAARPQARPIPAGAPEFQEEPVLPVTINAVEMVKNSVDITGLQDPPESGKQQENVFYIYGENPNETVTIDRSTTTSGNRLVVDVPRPVTVAVPNASRPAARPAAPAPAPARKPAAAPATVASAPARTHDNYWVQTGSFSTKVRAEGVRETLSTKGITSLIENREVEGKTYFRVRVGPYTSKNEADYWLALIKSINGFEDSQVWKSPAR